MKIRAYKNENPLEELIDVLEKASRKGCDSVEIRLGFNEINKLLKELQWAFSLGTADTTQMDCDTCRHYKLACELFSEVCKYEPTTQTETQNSNNDTPQTEICDTCKYRSSNVFGNWCVGRDTCDRYEADTPQTEERSK